MENYYNSNKGLTSYLVNTRVGKSVVAGATGLALLVTSGCATIGEVNGVPVNRNPTTIEQSTEKSWIEEHPYWTIAIVGLVAGGVYLAGSSGGHKKKSTPAATTTTTTTPTTTTPTTTKPTTTTPTTTKPTPTYTAPAPTTTTPAPAYTEPEPEPSGGYGGSSG